MGRVTITSLIIDEILKHLLHEGTLLTSPITISFGPQLNKRLLRYIDIKQDQKDIQSILRYMQQQGLITSRQKDGLIELRLTEKSQKRLRQLEIQNLAIAIPKDWDNKWRMVMFDIPESNRRSREILAGKLKDMGFLQVQRSVWIHPFPCQEEIRFLAESFGISQNITYAEISKIDLHNQLIQHFKHLLALV